MNTINIMPGKFDINAGRILAILISLAFETVFASEETVQSLTQQLWPAERIEAAIQAVERQKEHGLISDEAYARRMNMLKERAVGIYIPEALSVENPPLNFIQNGGFEKINRNSAVNRSRWLWWGGWSWGGNYVNRWEDRPDYVHSGEYSARIECQGETGRIGISTPPLPVIPGAREYQLTFWARGEGNNQIFINFEEGVTGTLRQQLDSEWQEITVLGKPVGKADTYTVYFYVIGAGTVWFDDAVLVPIGGNLEDF